MFQLSFYFAAGLVLIGVSACNDTAGAGDIEDTETSPGETARKAMAVYTEPHPEGNTFACAHCHALQEPPDDGFRRPGHSFVNVTRRLNYKNGQIDDMLAAANTCLDEWMAAPAWASGDAEWLNLHAWLDEMSDADTADPIAFEIVPPPKDVSGGDVDAGHSFFNGACAICHGRDAVGTERAPALTGDTLEPEYIAERIRLSGAPDSPTYTGLTGGRMPFFAADRLSDEALLDLVAFVDQSEPPGIDPTDMPDTQDPDRTCEATHAKVGQSATLTTYFHNVQGTATIVDDCTIRLDDFHFDGNGIFVQLYGGLGGDYASGFGMGPNLLRADGYDGVSLSFTLPEDKTLDDLDGISIWCVTVGIDFGSGQFQ